MQGWTAILAPIFVCLGVAMAAPGAAAQECLADWSVAAPIVKREGLVTVEELSGHVRQTYKGDIVKASLCSTGGGNFAFRLVVRGSDGQLRTVLVDAREPFKP